MGTIKQIPSEALSGLKNEKLEIEKKSFFKFSYSLLRWNDRSGIYGERKKKYEF